MYLNEIRLYGFKSFPEPINLKLNRGITGFVGPNGSGKSNVVDAIRWVLGEQSGKELRASVMDDLIFNGTYKRKPSNLSDVSLKFINDGELPLDFSEIEFERKLYRTGESQYLINKESVRLKDLQKMLYEAGLGVKSYSLFKRALIEDIVNNKPDALRNLFEESAGISQYKHSRKETLRKLILTQENLYRIDDLIAEIEKQHRELKRQANRASRYAKYKVIVENLTQYVLNQKIKKYNEQIEYVDKDLLVKNEKIDVLSNDLETIKEKLNARKEERRSVLKELTSAIDEKEKIQEKTYEINSEIKLSEQQMKHNSERITFIKENREKQISKQPLRKERQTKYNNKLTLLIEKKEEVNQQIEGDKNNEIEVIYRNQEKEFNDYRDELRQRRNRILILESENKTLKYKIDNIKSQYNEKIIEKENEQEKVKNKNIEIENTVTKYDKQREELDKLRTMLKNINDKLVELKGIEKELNLKFDNVKHKSSENNAYINQLRNRMKESNSSFTEIEETIGEQLNLMRNMIKAEKEYEPYIKSALSYFINTFIISVDNIEKIIETDTGLLSFVIMDKNIVHGDYKNGLDKFIKAPDYIKNVLSNFVILDNDEDIYQTDNKCYYIAKNGIVKTPAGIFVKSGEMEILNFKDKIVDIEKENQKIEIELLEIKQKREMIIKEIEATSREREDIQKGITENEQKIQFTERNIEAIKIGIESGNNLIDKIEMLTNKMQTEISNIEKKAEKNTNEKTECENKLENNKNEIIERENDYNKIKEKFIIFNNRKDELEKILKDSNTEISLLQKEMEDLQKTMQAAEEEIMSSEEKTDKLKNQIMILDKDIEVKREEMQKFQTLLINSGNKVNELKAQESEIEINIDEFTESEEEKQISLNELKENKQHLLIEKEKYLTEKGIDEQKVDEYFEIDYELIEKYKETGEDELNHLKEKMIRMEPINQLAFQEFQETEERLEKMNEQKNDILHARENLERTIKTLDAKAKTVFAQYFDTIRTNFKQLFYDIFQSGHADIILSDESNPLNSDIQIIFEPKEKKVDKLVMLSDGERAMMIITLLFSMYMVRPTPVCIMDEIDGPLDDANVENFIKLLQRFREKTQFILITHNKRTMEFCDYLFGVTMEESGVTTIVSLNLQTVAKRFYQDNVQ